MVNLRIIALTAAAMATLSADGMDVQDLLNHHAPSAQAPCSLSPQLLGSQQTEMVNLEGWQSGLLAYTGAFVRVFGEHQPIITENPGDTITIRCTGSERSKLEEELEKIQQTLQLLRTGAGLFAF
jgi:hypothetical protein